MSCEPLNGTAICRHCRRPIVKDRFLGREGPSTWRHTNRWGTGGYAGCLMERFAEPGPPIVVLCGSTRFSEAWAKARYDLTLAGEIVLTIGCDTKSDQGLGITAEQKAALDELHKRKIDLADRVLVLNVGGYIGDSTRSEIAYATWLEKPIDYLEPPSPTACTHQPSAGTPPTRADRPT